MSQLNQTEAKPRARRVMQPLAPPLPVQGCMELLEFCVWARISRSAAFKEIAAGRLKVARVGSGSVRRKPIVPIESAKAWLDALMAKAA